MYINYIVFGSGTHHQPDSTSRFSSYTRDIVTGLTLSLGAPGFISCLAAYSWRLLISIDSDKAHIKAMKNSMFGSLKAHCWNEHFSLSLSFRPH